MKKLIAELKWAHRSKQSISSNTKLKTIIDNSNSVMLISYLIGLCNQSTLLSEIWLLYLPKEFIRCSFDLKKNNDFNKQYDFFRGLKVNGNLRASFIFKSFFAKYLNFTCRDENVVKLLKAILYSII